MSVGRRAVNVVCKKWSSELSTAESAGPSGSWRRHGNWRASTQDWRSQDFPDSLKCALNLKLINPEDLALLDKRKDKLVKS